MPRTRRTLKKGIFCASFWNKPHNGVKNYRLEVMQMNENKKDPGENSREKAGTKLPPIVTPPIPPVPNRAWTEMKKGDKDKK